MIHSVIYIEHNTIKMYTKSVMSTYKFPEGFIWGAATAAHQIEGNNTNSDWWEWEQNKPTERRWPEEPSGIACDSYNRYEEDFDLCTQFNSNAVRISVEWARIEPNEGEFDQNEIEHYKKVLNAAKDRGLKTFVTLHHFTNPQWFSNKKGWVNLRSPMYFARYAQKCAEEFGELIDKFITINEPQVWMNQAYGEATWPPAKNNIFLMFLVHINFIDAHRKAYKRMRKKTDTPIGIVKNVGWFETVGKSTLFDKILAKIGMWLTSDFFIIQLKGTLDFVGVNYYFTHRFIGGKIKNPDDYVSDLQWWINPLGLKFALLHLKKYKLPIYITENGLADASDMYRGKFIQDHLTACAQAIEEGVPLKGYLHWSLLDNYEWHHGFWPRFGLVEIDRKNNLQRKPRESFHYYSQICKNNSIELSNL